MVRWRNCRGFKEILLVLPNSAVARVTAAVFTSVRIPGVTPSPTCCTKSYPPHSRTPQNCIQTQLCRRRSETQPVSLPATEIA